MTIESGPPENPRRLIEERDLVGELLRSADEEFGEKLDEPAAFRALEKRRLRRHARVAWAFGIAALGVALAGLALERAPEPEAAALATPEVLGPVSPAALSRAAEPPVAPDADPPPLPPLPPLPPMTAPVVNDPPKRVRVDAPAPPHEEPDCPALIRNRSLGASVERLSCFRALAQGSGLSAEAALFELARLTGSRPGKGEEVLTLLAEHTQRFPEGALRGEVAELRIRTLYELERDVEALRASEEALGTPWGRVLSGKLHLLRGKIYEERLKDCERAAPEYVALLGEPTVEADEAEFRRARCFERLGRLEEAVPAYERYLKRPGANHRTTAQARLNALTVDSTNGRSAGRSLGQ